jgi:hypothetical protein
MIMMHPQQECIMKISLSTLRSHRNLLSAWFALSGLATLLSLAAGGVTPVLRVCLILAGGGALAVFARRAKSKS